MFCPKCGAENEEGTLFCSKCGGRLPDEVQNSRPRKSSEDENISLEDTIIMKPVEPSKNKAGRNGTEISKNQKNTVRYNENLKKHNVRTNDDDIINSKKNGSSMKTAVIVLSCCLAVLLIILSVFAIKLSSNRNSVSKKEDTSTVVDNSGENKKNNEENIKENESEKEDTKQQSETQNKEDDTPVSYSTIPVDMVYATTEGTDGEYVFSASNAIDSKLSTAWSPDAETGAGESITLCFSRSRTVHGIKIANGYSKTEADYARYARIKDVTIKFPDGRTFSAVLKDNTISLQDINLKDAAECQSLTVVVESVYPGEEGLPFCISEIEVF